MYSMQTILCLPPARPLNEPFGSQAVRLSARYQIVIKHEDAHLVHQPERIKSSSTLGGQRGAAVAKSCAQQPTRIQ